MKVDGQYVKSVAEWIDKSLPPEQAAEVTQARDARVLKVFKNNVLTRFIPGSQQQQVFRIDKTAENARLWEMLEKAQPRPGPLGHSRA